MMISIIGIDATKNAAQISIRTGRLNLFEKKTTSPPPPGHPRSTSTSFDGFQHRSYLLLNRRYCLGWEQKSPVRGQSILRCPAKLTRVQLHKRARGKDLPCSLLPAIRTCLFSYVRAVSQAVLGWSTARNFLALRGQRDFINSSIPLWEKEKSEIKREMIPLTVDRRRNVAYPHSILTGCTVSYSHPPSSFSSDTPACRLCSSSAGFNNEVFLTPSSILERYNYTNQSINLKSGTNLMKYIFYLFFCRSI